MDNLPNTSKELIKSDVIPDNSLDSLSEIDKMRDHYDIFENVIKIHSKTLVFNPDFTLSDLDTKERWFIREQVRLINMMVKYIQYKPSAVKLKTLLMIDVDAIVTLSRAKNGRIIKGAIKMLVGANPQDFDDKGEPEKKGLWGTLTGFMGR